MLQGMKPVIGVEEMAMVIDRKDSIYRLQGVSTTREAICQCSVIGVVSTPDQSKLKEPFSAPF